MSRRRLIRFWLAIMGLLAATSPASAQVILYESATMGPTGQTTGYGLSNMQYVGSRFVVSSPVTVTAVGGHMFGVSQSLFAAIVSFPGSLPAPSGGNALAGTGTVIHASKTFSTHFPSDDLIIPLAAPVTLTPNGNTYALIFGAGLFSTNGSGGMPSNNTNTPAGIGSYFYCVDPDLPTYSWTNGIAPNNINNARFVVYATAVPEPSAYVLAGVALAASRLAARHRARRQ